MIKIIKTGEEWDLYHETYKVVDLTGSSWQSPYYYQWIRWFVGKCHKSETIHGEIWK